MNSENIETPPHQGQQEKAEVSSSKDGLRWLYIVLGVVMLAGVALNLANVIGRYAVGKPIFWAEEVLVGMVIWGVFFGAAVVSWRGDHLNMDLFYARMGRSSRFVINCFISSVMVGICLFVAWQSWTILQMFHQTEAVSAGAQIPKVIPHSALMVGFLLSALAVIVRWRRWLTEPHGSNG
jgi:TRAP-type C4-dicarboxylate transport system permease small subunit